MCISKLCLFLRKQIINYMKDKIQEKLKTAYASLGLGDEILTSLAESLAGVATDDNIETLIAAQKPLLEQMQKNYDKRVADALAKHKASQPKAPTVEAEKPAPKVEPVSVAPVTSPVSEVKPQPAPQKVEQPQPIPSLSDSAEWKELKRAMGDIEKWKKEQEKERRQKFINQTAKDMGVPDWRIDEGLGIGDDADEEAIKQKITTVANNLRANMLPNKGVTLVSTPEKVDDSFVKDVAARLVPIRKGKQS